MKFDKRRNLEERLEFVRLYARWVKSVDNATWSKQQAEFINSLMQSAKNFKLSPEEYLKLKESVRRVRPIARTDKD